MSYQTAHGVWASKAVYDAELSRLDAAASRRQRPAYDTIETEGDDPAEPEHVDRRDFIPASAALEHDERGRPIVPAGRCAYEDVGGHTPDRCDFMDLDRATQERAVNIRMGGAGSPAPGRYDDVRNADAAAAFVADEVAKLQQQRNGAGAPRRAPRKDDDMCRCNERQDAVRAEHFDEERYDAELAARTEAARQAMIAANRVPQGAVYARTDEERKLELARHARADAEREYLRRRRWG